jgi:hypothetical protein
MYSINIWYQLNIHRRKVKKVLTVILLSFGLIPLAVAQGKVGMNNPNYDDRFLSYGFLIGLHTTGYRLQYHDDFAILDSLHSIQPKMSPGFSLGFIVNLKLTEFLDLRLLPKVAFYEHALDYYFTGGTVLNQVVESTVVEFPLMLKYKSARRGNVRMYMVGGVKPGIEASGKNNIENEDDAIPINNTNLSIDVGFGFDFYYPLFKFSPELRFSRGIANMLSSEKNIYSQGVKQLNMNTITLYLLFQ